MNLKPDELEFLKRHGVKPEEVHDGQRHSQARRKSDAERLGKILVLGSPCNAEGHRLRTRAGHCVQCDPKKLAYQTRHTAPGYVYIAGSLKGRVIKMGTASNMDQRHRQLCAEKYGGLGDWVVLFHMKVNEGGKVEQTALSRLQKHTAVRTYVKDGTAQDATEILRCGVSIAMRAVADAIGEGDRSELWMHNHWREYDFK